MNTLEFCLFARAPKSVRKWIHDRPSMRRDKTKWKPFMMLNLVPRPSTLTRCDGLEVRYEGP